MVPKIARKCEHGGRSPRPVGKKISVIWRHIAEIEAFVGGSASIFKSTRSQQVDEGV